MYKSSVAYLSPIKLSKKQDLTDNLSREHFKRVQQISQVLKMKTLKEKKSSERTKILSRKNIQSKRNSALRKYPANIDIYFE